MSDQSLKDIFEQALLAQAAYAEDLDGIAFYDYESRRDNGAGVHK